MPRPRPLEVRALLPLLEQDWETPETLAIALIQALDKVRASRTSYVVVIQHGFTEPIYAGMGPYPGRKSAQNALVARGLDKSRERAAIVPILSPEGHEELLRDVG